jgi:ribose transport system substrate-binding protein
LRQKFGSLVFVFVDPEPLLFCKGDLPMKLHPRSLALSAVLLGAALAACQEPYHQKEEQFYLISANINLPYWQEAEAGLRDAATGMGVKAEMDGPTTLSPKEELDSFNKAVALHPAGILVSVTNQELFKPAIDSAVLQGIPVICIDADAPDSHRVLFVGTDNFRAGQESGKRMADILKGQGQIVIVTVPGQPNLDERVRGVTEALKKYPGIKVAQTVDDKGDSRLANDGISAILGKKEKVDGVICLEASGGSGIAEALHRLDLTSKIAIVSFDKDPETLDGIEKGWINATIVQKPYIMAYYGLKFADDLHHNAVHEFKDWRTAPAAPMPAWVDTGTAIVDKTNLAAFREALAAHPKPL